MLKKVVHVCLCLVLFIYSTCVHKEMDTARELSSVLNKMKPLSDASKERKRKLKDHMEAHGPDVLQAGGKTYTLKRRKVVPSLSYKSLSQDLQEYDEDIDVSGIVSFLKDRNRKRAKEKTSLKIS